MYVCILFSETHSHFTLQQQITWAKYVFWRTDRRKALTSAQYCYQIIIKRYFWWQDCTPLTPHGTSVSRTMCYTARNSSCSDRCRRDADACKIYMRIKLFGLQRLCTATCKDPLHSRTFMALYKNSFYLFICWNVRVWYMISLFALHTQYIPIPLRPHLFQILRLLHTKRLTGVAMGVHWLQVHPQGG